MEGTIVNFSTICRTCMSKLNLKPIFEKTGNKLIFSEDLLSFTGLRIKHNDDLPQNMCVKCFNLINASLEFKKQCKAVEIQLLKQQIRNEILIKVEENGIEAEKDSESNEKDNNGMSIKTEENVEDYDNYSENIEGDRIKIFVKEEEITDTYKDSDIPESNDIDDSVKDEKVSKSTGRAKKKLKLDKIKTQKTVEKEDLPYIAMDDTKIRNTRVTCKFCQKNLSIRSIYEHIARCHPNGDMQRVKCDFCDKVVSKEKLNRHKLLTHGLECVRCGYCKQEFNSRDSLLQHVVSCADKKKKRKASEAGRTLVDCDVCHQTMQKSSLRMHKRVKHAGMGPVCEHCGKHMSNKLRLIEHYRAKHGYDKFKCSYCDFQSSGIVAMRNHERRHRGEKPFVCSCGAKFHAAYLLAQHKQTHREEKLFKCEQCPSSFKRSNSLRAHSLSRHSSARHACGVCARSFRCRHYAVRHMRLAHLYRGPVPDLQIVQGG